MTGQYAARSFPQRCNLSCCMNSRLTFALVWLMCRKLIAMASQVGNSIRTSHNVSLRWKERYNC